MCVTFKSRFIHVTYTYTFRFLHLELETAWLISLNTVKSGILIKEHYFYITTNPIVILTS